MATSNNDKLFNYEYDFKEQHTQHLKRPALVAIKKPLLSNNEMEDVLTRLLNLHVPAILDEQAAPSGIGRRAYLIDNSHYIQRSSASGENTSFVQRGIFEIKHRNNIYLAPTIDDKNNYNPLYFWLSPDSLSTFDRQGEQLNFFSYSASDAASTDAKYTKTHMYQPGDPGYIAATTSYDPNVTKITSERNAVVYKSFNPYFSTQSGEFTYNPNDVNTATVKFDLFLLNKTDHTRLLCDRNTRITTLKDILDKAYLFEKNGLPQFKGYHEIYNPNDPKGLHHIMDNSAAQRAFGYLPRTIKKAYHWEFYCPTTTRVAVLHSDYIKKDKASAFSKLVITLKVLYEGYDGDKSTIPMKQLRNWIYLFDAPASAQDGSSTKIDYKAFVNDAVKRDQYIRGVSESINALPDKDVSDVTKPYAVSALVFAKQNISNSITGVQPTKTVSTKSQMKAAIAAYVSDKDDYLSLLGKFEETYRNELADAKAAAARRQYIKPKKACDITLGKFKVEYYAILLKRVQEKYNKLKYFIETAGTVKLTSDKAIIGTSTNKEVVDDVYGRLIKLMDSSGVKNSNPKNSNLNEQEKEFIQLAEQFFYNPFSGFYITSYSETRKEVLSPYWNSIATTDMLSTGTNSAELNAGQKDLLINNQNKDVSSISIDRVTNGMSTATVTIKNDKEKYNYEQSDVLNRANFIIEPMDEIAIYLPTTQTSSVGGVVTNNDKLHVVFSGVISRVVGRNNAGMHSISIQAECYKKYLKVNRTNTRPSATRAESDNKMVQAFDMPYAFYNTIENWMTYMFTTSLTTFGSELERNNSYDKMLFTVSKKPIKETVTHTVIKAEDVVLKETEQVQLTYTEHSSLRPDDDVGAPIRTVVLSGKNEAQQVISAPTTEIISKKIVTKVTYEYEPGVIKDKERTITVGTYQQADFADPLLTYIWYKVNSRNFPKEEEAIMESSLKSVISDYIDTVVIGDAGTPVEVVSGCKDFKSYLKQGKRAAYFVFKTRNSQYGVCVAKIIGTSQPAYLLKTANFDIQFSAWQTNNDIIQKFANKFNFLYYTDKDGIVLFTPYNFDLTTLNTENNTTNIDTDKMFVYRSKRDVQHDDNVQILKDQYIINFTNTDNDKDIINWLTLTGNWQIDGSQAVDQFTKALVKDPVLITRFGYRTAKNVTILGIQDEQALRLYGLSYMDRNNKKYRSATASVVFDSRMDVNLPYYVPTDEVIYFCEGMRIQYTAGETCVADMNLSYGKKPIIELAPYVEKTPNRRKNIGGTCEISLTKTASYGENNEKLTLEQRLDQLFLKYNAIKPSTWAQYKKLFLDNRARNTESIDAITNRLTQLPMLNQTTPVVNQDTDGVKMAVNASICCFNGLLWDNVAGIAFEELLYNYGWLNAGLGAGLTTASVGNGPLTQGITGQLMESLSSFAGIEQPNRGSLLKSNTDLVPISERNAIYFSQINQETQRVLNTFFVDVPSTTSSDVPPQLAAQYYLYDDLRVEGILNPNDYQN